jgi:hypothetical protein
MFVYGTPIYFHPLLPCSSELSAIIDNALAPLQKAVKDRGLGDLLDRARNEHPLLKMEETRMGGSEETGPTK